jgi:ribokinase
VVGHVETVEFARVHRVPRPGEIVEAGETWTQPAGGGAVAARELRSLAGEVTFLTALGDDALGRAAEEELSSAGIRVEAVYRSRPQRRCFVFLDDAGERTITTIGEKLVPHAGDPLPWSGLEDVAAVYFCGGDPGAVQEARRAKVLVATARELPTLQKAGVVLDVLVHSVRDASERYRPGDLDPPPAAVLTTEGPAGGRYAAAGTSGRWAAARLPGALVDAYGAGDCFAAGVTYALGSGRSLEGAIELGALCAARALTRRGASISPRRI